MLKFLNILNFPSYLRDRNDSLKELISEIVSIQILNNNAQIIGRTKNYTQTIIFEENQIDLKSLVKISCTCQSFLYEFSEICRKNNCLANEKDFIQVPSKHNKKSKNPFKILSGCKHIINFSNLIARSQPKINKYLKSLEEK